MRGGLDLSAKPKNPSGACIIEKLHCATLRSDEEIVEFFQGVELVAVDAPLSMEIPWRDSERELIRRGYRPLPLSMEVMGKLHQRAKGLNLPLIETFVQPMRIPLVEVLRRRMGWNKHERDAFLASLVAKHYPNVERVGEKHPIYILPKEVVKKEVEELLRSVLP